jgi:hypothetical protein
MNKQLLLEEKHFLVKEKLRGNLAKKYSIEVRIREELEELKKLEISLEKMRANQVDTTPSMFCTH